MRRWVQNFAVVAVVFLLGSHVWSTVVHDPTEALCDTLVALVERSNDTIRQHPYYKRHPAELPKALEQNNQTLRELRSACD